jgi:hypothetical protein
MFTHLPDSSHDCRELAIAQGSKAKPTSRVTSTTSKQSKGQSNTNGGQQLACPRPHQGDPIPPSFVFESQVAGFLHTPSCGLASSHLGSPNRDYPGTLHETTWPEFVSGHPPLSGPMERHLPLLGLTRVG